MTTIGADLHGRLALVTGGTRGIGAATCRMLAAHGATVVVNGRDASAADEVVASIRAAGGSAFPAVADCAQASGNETLRRAVEELGELRVLATFAGGDGPPRPLAETPEREWRETLDANLTSTFLTLRAFLPGMIGRRAGSIVTMASTAARRPTAASPAYTAAKAGIVALTRQAAHEAGPHGVRVNCVAPSIVMTESQRRKMSDEQRREAEAATPLRRLGVPDDVAAATLFLASDSSAWLTGITLDVAGGRVMP